MYSNINVDLEKIKSNLTNMYIAFNNINNENAKYNRGSDIPENMIKQLKSDKIFFNSLRNNALSIFDICNKLMMITDINQ